jgi:putative DNA primase/helicase
VSASNIARALGGRRNGQGYLCKCPVQSHGRGHGDKNPSLSIADGDGKLLVRCFAGCDSRDVLAELRRRGLLELSRDDNTPRRFTPPPAPTKPEEPEPDERALGLWRKAIPAHGTLVEKYLRARCITLDIPPSIRFLHYVDYMPRIGFSAMVAAVQRPDRQVIAVHVTFLDPSGERKAKVTDPRKTFGKLGTGAVRLGPSCPKLGIAEGTETALSAQELFGVPVWACLGSTRMDRLSIPPDVQKIILFADRDKSGAEAVKRSAEAYRLIRYVEWKFPPEGCGDFNDELQANVAGGA